MGPRIDPHLFRDAFNRDYPFLCRLVAGIVGSPSAAEDVAQEAFIRLYRNPPPDLSNVRAWLSTVAVNLALNQLRSDRARARREEAYASPEDEVVRDEDGAATRKALAALPERDRTALLLKASGGTYREIAEALRVKEKSVGTLIARARQAFASEYARLKGSDNGVL